MWGKVQSVTHGIRCGRGIRYGYNMGYGIDAGYAMVEGCGMWYWVDMLYAWGSNIARLCSVGYVQTILGVFTPGITRGEPCEELL